MGKNSSFKKYNQGSGLPTNASQIVSVTVNDPTPGGFSSISFTADKVGKLYTNIRATSVGGGFSQLPVGLGGVSASSVLSANKIASLFGETINTLYEQQNLYSNAAVPIAGYIAGIWNITSASSNRWTLLQGFLVN
jgi:hypothetical protein